MDNKKYYYSTQQRKSWKKPNRFTWFLIPRKGSTRLNSISHSVYLKDPSSGHHFNFKTFNKGGKYKTTYSWTNLSKTLLKIKEIWTYCFVASIFLANTKTLIFWWSCLGSFMTKSLSLIIEAKVKHTQNACIIFRVYKAELYGLGDIWASLFRLWF